MAIRPDRQAEPESTAEPPEAPLGTGDAPAASESVGRSSARGFLWTTVAWGCNRVAILGLTLLLARLLTPEDFGVVTAALTIIAMLDAALDLGVGAAVIAGQERGINARIRTAFSLNLGISAVISALGMLLSPLIAMLFHAGGQAWVFALVFVYPLFRGAGQVNDAVLKRDQRFRRRTIVDALRAVARVAVSVPLALTVGGAVSIAAGIVVSELAAMLMLWALVPIRPLIRLQRETVRGLLGFGGQVTAIRLLGSFRSGFDYIVVGSLIGSAALGIYSMAYKLPELVIENVLWIFSAIALSTYARARSEGHEALLHAMLTSTRLLALYGLAAGTGLCVIARDAVPVLFSAQWTPAVVPMMLISVSLGIMSIAWASGDVFAAIGRPGVLLVVDIPATALMAAGFLLAARWGLVGVAMVHLIFNVVYCVARLVLVRRVAGVGVDVLMRALLPAVGVAALTAVLGFAAVAVLPPGRLLSLIGEMVACAVAVVVGSLLFARDTVIGALAVLRPARRG